MTKVNDQVTVEGREATVVRVGDGWAKVRWNDSGFNATVNTKAMTRTAPVQCQVPTSQRGARS